MEKSAIILFYEGDGTDHMGRTYNDIMEFSNKEFDGCHDFIQWLFPLHQDSRMTNVRLPLITEVEHEYFKNSTVCKDKMRLALFRFKTFLHCMGTNNWCTDMDHNLLRITRVIRSLRFFGLDTEAYEMYIAFSMIADSRKIMPSTLEYWKRAYHEPVFDSLY
jgi:hypothetical protein